MSLIGIARSGDVVGVFKKVFALVSGHLPVQVSDLVGKVASDEGVLLWGFAKDAFARAVAGQSPASIADAEWSNIETQVPSLAKKDFADFLGLISRAPETAPQPVVAIEA